MSSFVDGMKYKTMGRDAKKAMLNAEMLLSKDPRHISYMEALLKNAAKARYQATVMWIGEILSEVETLDAFCDALLAMAEEAHDHPEVLHEAPHTMPVGRLDEVAANRKPIVRWRQE